MRVEKTDLDTIQNVPDQLLGPGGAALGVGHDPDILRPQLDVGQEVVVIQEPLGDGLQVAACVLHFDSHYQGDFSFLA